MASKTELETILGVLKRVKYVYVTAISLKAELEFLQNEYSLILISGHPKISATLWDTIVSGSGRGVFVVSGGVAGDFAELISLHSTISGWTDRIQAQLGYI